MLKKIILKEQGKEDTYGKLTLVDLAVIQFNIRVQKEPKKHRVMTD